MRARFRILSISTTRHEDYEDLHRVFIVPLRAEFDHDGAEPSEVDKELYEVTQSAIPSEFQFEEVADEYGRNGAYVLVEDKLPEAYAVGCCHRCRAQPCGARDMITRLSLHPFRLRALSAPLYRGRHHG